MDLEALVTDELRSEDIGGYTLDWFEVEASSLRPPHAKRVGEPARRRDRRPGSFTGDGPIDAVFQAINAATGVAAKLSEFTIGAVTEGQDALGEVSVVLEVGGCHGRRAGRLDGHHRRGGARICACAVGSRGALARRRSDRAARGLAPADASATSALLVRELTPSRSRDHTAVTRAAAGDERARSAHAMSSVMAATSPSLPDCSSSGPSTGARTALHATDRARLVVQPAPGASRADAHASTALATANATLRRRRRPTRPGECRRDRWLSKPVGRSGSPSA